MTKTGFVLAALVRAAFVNVTAVSAAGLNNDGFLQRLNANTDQINHR